MEHISEFINSVPHYFTSLSVEEMSLCALHSALFYARTCLWCMALLFKKSISIPFCKISEHCISVAVNFSINIESGP